MIPQSNDKMKWNSSIFLFINTRIVFFTYCNVNEEKLGKEQGNPISFEKESYEKLKLNLNSLSSIVFFRAIAMKIIRHQREKKQGYPISIHEINLPLLWLAVPFLPPPLNPIFISPGLSFLCRSFILFIDVFFTASEIDGYTHRPAREHVHNRGIPSQRNGC